MKYTDAQIQLLADVFSRMCQETFSEEELDKVIELNKADGYQSDICHTHDYYDANQIMLDAFLEVFEIELYFDCEDDITIINRAWMQAKRSDFGVKPRIS